MGVPGGWEFHGDECSGGWVSRGMGVSDTKLKYTLMSIWTCKAPLKYIFILPDYGLATEKYTLYIMMLH